MPIVTIFVVTLVLGSIAYFSTQPSPIDYSNNSAIMNEHKEMGGIMSDAMMQNGIEIALLAQNNSREEGTATLVAEGNKVRVTIAITGGAQGVAQPAHIHVGACPTPGAVKYPLNNVVNGVSETVIDVSMTQLTQEFPLAINIHKSAQEVKTFVSCGDISNETVMQ